MGDGYRVYTEEECEEAYNALMPWLPDILGQLNRFRHRGVAPTGIIIPDWYPARCGGTRLVGLPVYFGPVSMPVVVSDV